VPSSVTFMDSTVDDEPTRFIIGNDHLRSITST
jgi:hypothetical protein